MEKMLIATLDQNSDGLLQRTKVNVNKLPKLALWHQCILQYALLKCVISPIPVKI